MQVTLHKVSAAAVALSITTIISICRGLPHTRLPDHFIAELEIEEIFLEAHETYNTTYWYDHVGRRVSTTTCDSDSHGYKVISYMNGTDFHIHYNSSSNGTCDYSNAYSCSISQHEPHSRPLPNDDTTDCIPLPNVTDYMHFTGTIQFKGTMIDVWEWRQQLHAHGMPYTFEQVFEYVVTSDSHTPMQVTSSTYALHVGTLGEVLANVLRFQALDHFDDDVFALPELCFAQKDGKNINARRSSPDRGSMHLLMPLGKHFLETARGHEVHLSYI